MRRKMAAAAVLTVAALTVATVSAAQGGSGNIRDDKKLSDKISVSLKEFPKLPATQAYEGWLVSDDGSKKLSVGIIALDAAGGGKVDFTSPAGENLVGGYDTLVITVEPVPDADPNPSATVAAQDKLPKGSLVHIRHLLSQWKAAPGETGLATGTRSQAELASIHADLAKAAADAGNLAVAKLHGEHIVNIIEGSKGPNFGDKNGNGMVENPGDGFGVLTYASLGATHAGLAMATPDATTLVKVHGQHVLDASNNVTDWATLARDQALPVAAAADINAAKAGTPELAVVAGKAFKGFDANGNGSIELVKGEAGSLIAYEHSQLMATHSLVATPAPTLPASGGGTAAPIAPLVAGVAALIAAVGLALARRRIRARS